jgi:membrane-associated PAP2 superfamily phosphatase
MRPKTGFWKGALSFLIILAVALLCGFVAYLLWYANYEYKRLGSEFHLLECLGWTSGASFAFFLLLDVCPATIIAGVCYPVGYLASFQVFRLMRNGRPSR